MPCQQLYRITHEHTHTPTYSHAGSKIGQLKLCIPTALWIHSALNVLHLHILPMLFMCHLEGQSSIRTEWTEMESIPAINVYRAKSP